MVQNPCLSKSHTKFGLQDHPCFRILLAWDKYCTGTVLEHNIWHKVWENETFLFFSPTGWLCNNNRILRYLPLDTSTRSWFAYRCSSNMCLKEIRGGTLLIARHQYRYSIP